MTNRSPNVMKSRTWMSSSEERASNSNLTSVSTWNDLPLDSPHFSRVPPLEICLASQVSLPEHSYKPSSRIPIKCPVLKDPVRRLRGIEVRGKVSQNTFPSSKESILHATEAESW